MAGNFPKLVLFSPLTSDARGCDAIGCKARDLPYRAGRWDPRCRPASCPRPLRPLRLLCSLHFAASLGLSFCLLRFRLI